MKIRAQSGPEGFDPPIMLIPGLKGVIVRHLTRLRLVSLQFPFPAATMRSSRGLCRFPIAPSVRTSVGRLRLLTGLAQRKLNLLNSASGMNTFPVRLL